MTEQLKVAIDLAIQKLPDREQNMLARYITNILEAYDEKANKKGNRRDSVLNLLEAYEKELEMDEEEREWDAIVNKPGFIEKMEKVMHDSLASGVEDGGFCP